MIDASNAARRDRAPDGETEARDAETLLRRARRDRGAGKDAEAVRQLRDAVRIRPDHPALHVELAGDRKSVV